jgi:TonB family protein
VKKSNLSKQTIRAVWQVTLCAVFLLSCIALLGWSYGSDQESRKARINVPPEYPELARRLNLKGIARVEIKVSASGDVTDVKEVGGNPVLLEALKRAVKKWKYEPSERENTIEVKYEFVP